MIKPYTALIVMFSVLFTINLYAQTERSKTFRTDRNGFDPTIDMVLKSINPDSIRFVIQKLQDFDTRLALAGNRRDVALWILQRFRDIGYQNVYLDSFRMVNNYLSNGCLYFTWQYNVVAELEGYSDTSRHYILGAHYDAITNKLFSSINYRCPPIDMNLELAPGADDNASGVAATLEIARIFKQFDIKPIHKIHFVAFAAEELWLWGSRFMAGKFNEQQRDIILMINNDMIANNNKVDKPWIFKMNASAEWIEILVEEIVEHYTELELNTSVKPGYSDQFPFTELGYDAVFFHENDFSKNYHTVYDVVDSLDLEYCAEITKLSCGLLLMNNIISIGINENLNEMQNVLVFPNPSAGIVNITIRGYNSPINLRISNILGQIVYSSTLYSQFNTINLNGITSGVLIYTISDESGMFQTGRIILKQ